MTLAGMNLDVRNSLANPPASALEKFAWVRLPYNVSAGRGSTDLDAAYALYSPYINALLAAGLRVILVAGHQFFGEASGYDWNRMTALDWESLSKRFVEMLGRAARQYAGRGIVWQIWNEQDQGGASAVGVPPSAYGSLFNASYATVKSVDSSAKVITGGLVSGPGTGMQYFRAAGILSCDGVAIHTYGAGAGGLFGDFGTITSQLNEWAKLNKPIFITEWGLLNRHNEPVERAAGYAKAFMRDISGRVRAAVWFAWRDGQTHDCYGVVSYSGQPKTALIDALTAETGTVPEPEPFPGPISDDYLPVSGLVARLNVRAMPTTAALIMDIIKNGDPIKPLPQYAVDNSGRWRKIQLPSGALGWVHTTAAGKLRVDL